MEEVRPLLYKYPKVGVPPESIYVTHGIVAGNLKISDKGEKVFADDSTSAEGKTWITIRRR